VPGLKASQVTVTDQSGVTLSRQVAETQGMEAVSARLQQKKAVEQYLVGKMMEVLRKAFDPDQVMVSVDATLDFSETKTTRESVLPAEGAPADGVLRRRESKFGTDAGPHDEGSVTTEVEYQLGRSVAEIVETPGRILRLNVAVLVPDTLTVERRERIKELVSVAAGLDSARGDAVAIYPLDSVVTRMTESQAAAPDAAEYGEPAIPAHGGNGWPDLLARHVTLVVAALVLLVLLLIFGLRLSGLRRVSVKSSLSPQERDRILLQLQQWLETEPSTSERKEAGA
jgi:flagellar M-ring protein FliF